MFRYLTDDTRFAEHFHDLASPIKVELVDVEGALAQIAQGES